MNEQEAATDGKKRAGPLGLFLLALCGLSLAAAFLGGSSFYLYWAATQNIDQFTAIMKGGMYTLMTAGFALMVSIAVSPFVVARWKRIPGWLRVSLIAGCVIPPVMIVLLFFAQPVGSAHTRYLAGFRIWAKQHVDVGTIQRWGAARQPVEQATPVDKADWPSEISRLDPLEVDQLKDGIAITWGYTEEFTSRRQVFVSFPGKDPPETTKWGDSWNEGDAQWKGSGRWLEAQTNLWVSSQ